MTQRKSKIQRKHIYKPDMSKNNPLLEQMIINHDESELYPLRINKKTVIFVTYEKFMKRITLENGCG